MTTEMIKQKFSEVQQLKANASFGKMLSEWEQKWKDVPRAAINDGPDTVDIWLHGIIGDDYDGCDSMTVSKILAANPGKRARFRINSPGGLAYHGVAMYNAIDAHNGPTEAIIEGMAGSAASLIAIACENVRCYAGAVFVPHYSLIVAMGHKSEIRDALASVERLDMDMERFYSEASGQTIEKVQADLEGPNGDGTRFSAEEAMAAGYVDEVIQHNKQKTAARAEVEEPEAKTVNRIAAKRFEIAAMTIGADTQVAEYEVANLRR